MMTEHEARVQAAGSCILAYLGEVFYASRAERLLAARCILRRTVTIDAGEIAEAVKRLVAQEYLTTDEAAAF